MGRNYHNINTEEDGMRKENEKHKEKNETTQAKKAWKILVLFLLAAACIVFEILTLLHFKQGFIAKNAAWLITLSILLTVLLLALGIVFLMIKKERFYKFLLTVFYLLLFFLVVLFIVVKTDFITILQSPQLYREFLEKTGAWMPILYILLQFFQVVLLPIPSVVSTLAGVALFGPLKATIYSLIGIIAGSFVGFFIGRKLGYKAVAWLVGEDELKKWLKKVKGKDYLILTLMFVLPLFPDDILCFVLGLSTMTAKYFSVIIVFSRLMGVAATCYSFELIPFTTWWGILIWAGIFLVVIVAFIFIYKNMDKINDWLKKKKFIKNSKK